VLWTVFTKLLLAQEGSSERALTVLSLHRFAASNRLGYDQIFPFNQYLQWHFEATFQNEECSYVVNAVLLSSACIVDTAHRSFRFHTLHLFWTKLPALPCQLVPIPSILRPSPF
jgi:hypothetical protein